MAFDQNYIPKDLRPINVARTLPDESRIAMASTASGSPFIATTAAITTSRNPEIFVNPDGSVPVLYPANVSDATGFVGLANGNPAPGIGLSAQRLPVPIGFASMEGVNTSGAAFAYNPNLGNMVVSSAVDHTANDMVDKVVVSPHLSNRINANGSSESASSGFGYNPNLGSRGSGNGVDYVSEQGVDDSVSEKKLKFLCSFGGQILPRPSDGMLRYVGGQTRIISVKKDVSFNELVQKMVDTYGQPVVIKYQLPDEDLDALVSVSCPDDLDNMMDEYEKLVQRDRSAKLRVFLFSATELGATGSVHFEDLRDSEQKYVNAVNGISGSVGCSGVARKESIASATSTQNSDFSGNDTFDSLGPGQVNVSAAPATSMFSPSWTPATPHDNSAKMVLTEPNPQVYADQCAVAVSIPMVKSGTPQTLSFQPEVERETSVPINVQQPLLAYDFPQGGIGIPTPSPQCQAYADPCQEITNHTDYMHTPAQMRFPNSPLLETAGSVFTEQQIHDNISGIAGHPVIPATPMTMAPASSQVSGRSKVVQPFVQLQQNCLEPSSDENTFGTRILQLPAESSYSAYQSQFPPPIIGGGYVRHPVSQPEHVFCDSLVPHQQVVFPETVQRLDDCHMCQKALPHAHSDPLVQNRRENSGVSPLPDSNPAHHRLLLGETIKSQPLNRGITGGGLRDGIVEHGVGAPSATYSQVESQQLEAVAFPKEETVDSHVSHDQLRPIGAMMETLWISPPENTANNEQKSSPIDQLSKEEYLDHANQPIAGINVLLGTTYNKPQLVIDSSHVVHTKVPPTCNEASSVNNSQPMDSYMISQEPISRNQGPCQHSNIEFHHLNSDEFSYAKPAFSALEPAYTFDGNPSVAEWKNDAPQLQQKIYPTRKEVACVVSPSLASSVGKGDVQDSSHSLFSNQDPWSMRHETHLPPPKPNKILIRKEAFDAKDPFSENQSTNAGELTTDELMLGAFSQPLSYAKKDFRSEQVQSAKGSAEERIKQELRAVAEDVAASVFSSASANADIMVHERNEPAYEASQDKEISSKDREMQHEAMLEDGKNKFPEKWNFRFLLSNGIGRLQIIKNADLEELQELGSGTFGTVYHGKWRGTDVAIKRINERCFAGKPSEQDRMVEDFWNEAIKLADLHHPNVLAFYGVVLDGPGGSVATVTEYMVNGSLRNALLKNERSLDKRKRLLIAMDVAFGMEYLHGKNIVHFDLKSDNLLVNLRDPHRPICKVGDLGLSKVKCHTLISGGVRGTLPWMAPELLNGSSNLVSEKVDVFSFGIVLWELLTGEEPYADLHYGAIIGGIVSNTLRPAVPASCDPEWKSLMERCWTSEPSERPSFTEIANELRVMAAKTPPKGQQLQV